MTDQPAGRRRRPRRVDDEPLVGIEDGREPAPSLAAAALNLKLFRMMHGGPRDE